MIWGALLLLAALALAPLAVSLRRAAGLRDRRGAALALHRAQLEELARERDTGRLDPASYDQAVLEVQRRLLAADAAPDGSVGSPLRFPLVVLFPLLPLLAMVLYLVGGVPGMEAQPLAERRAAAQREAAEADALISVLRQRLAGLEPRSEESRQGHLLLGNAEIQRGNLAAAAAAWRIALAAGFDPTLAALTGAALSRAEGQVSEEAAALFRRALAEGPADAPWRAMAEQRLRDAAR